MTRRDVRAWLVIAVAAAQLGCGGAQHKPDGERPSYAISAGVSDQLKQAADLLEAKDWNGALALLETLKQNEQLNPYEQAMVLQLSAGAHLGLEKPEQVVKDMEQALALDAMPEQQQLDATYNLAQAYFVSERFDQAADTFGKWAARATNPTSQQLYVIASAYAQTKRFKEALPYAERAIAGMKPPSEDALHFLVSVYYELDQQQDVTKTLERLTQQYPQSKEWWLQLAAAYDAIGKRDEALATLQSVYEKGFLTEEKQILAFAHAYLRSGQPEQAAALIEKHIADGTVSKGEGSLGLLATSWLAAKNPDKAAAALESAGDTLASGEPFMELARLEIARGQWTKARDALANAFAKGGLRSPAEAHLLLGAAHYHTKRKDAALASLGEAKRHPETQKCAEVWMQVVRTGKEGADAACLQVGAQP